MDPVDQIDIASLILVKYPDPRLRERCLPVVSFDARLAALVDKMFDIMYRHNGVGLAAPQVGVPLRLFIANPTMEEGDRRVYVNPEIVSQEGSQDGDEGCLSFPGITCRIKRYRVTTIRAQGLDGAAFEEVGEDLLARIFQHEHDHLEGTLLSDRMSAVAKIANRRALKDLEASQV